MKWTTPQEEIQTVKHANKTQVAVQDQAA